MEELFASFSGKFLARHHVAALKRPGNRGLRDTRASPETVCDSASDSILGGKSKASIFFQACASTLPLRRSDTMRLISCLSSDTHRPARLMKPQGEGKTWNSKCCKAASAAPASVIRALAGAAACPLETLLAGSAASRAFAIFAPPLTPTAMGVASLRSGATSGTGIASA